MAPLIQLFSLEGLARIGEDGRPTPALAESWRLADDGLSVRIVLRPNAKFHDGSPVDAASVVGALRVALPQYMGPAYTDISSIKAATDSQVEIQFRRPSPFLLEALEAQIQKPGAQGVGTGPYIASAELPELRANENYYLGRPTIDRVVVSTFPSVRSAWAEMLRDRFDMLYEVGVDALQSMTGSKSVAIFTYVRHYQYLVVLNSSSPALQSREVRRALSEAIDREALVRDTFDGHAMTSSGLIWPTHWAFAKDLASFTYQPDDAVRLLPASRRLRFTCLVRPDLERLALVLQHQLAAIGVEMVLQEEPLDGILRAMSEKKYDAALLDLVSGPNLFRPYQLWHSGGGPALPHDLGNAALDAALDEVRFAKNDDEYKQGVADIQRAIVEDPPAIFLAWGERARAVNRRFDVAAEPNRDVITTLRLWRPKTGLQVTATN